MSQDDAGDLLNVSRRSVQSAKKVLEDGSLVLVNKVESGASMLPKKVNIAVEGQMSGQKQIGTTK